LLSAGQVDRFCNICILNVKVACIGMKEIISGHTEFNKAINYKNYYRYYLAKK